MLTIRFIYVYAFIVGADTPRFNLILVLSRLFARRIKLYFERVSKEPIKISSDEEALNVRTRVLFSNCCIVVRILLSIFLLHALFFITTQRK
jgi:hypothetical protein